MKTIVIGSVERGILFQDRQFIKILAPGKYRFLNPLRKTEVEVYDITKSRTVKAGLSELLSNSFDRKLEPYLMKVAADVQQVAIVYTNNKVIDIVLPASEKLYWRGLGELRVKYFDISSEYEVSREIQKDLENFANEQTLLQARVAEKSVGLLYDSGVIVRVLEPGKYAFWKAQRNLTLVTYDTRIATLEVGGQEMLTSDKVTLRMNVLINYQLNDVVKAVRQASDFQGEIYRSSQLALREAVGGQSLDQLLENKEVLNQKLQAQIASQFASVGIEILRVGVKDIILPGEMRALLNQVVEAEKSAQAQNIRRREETAATRSLLNTARMLENNPTMLRLKELEAVERISERVEKLTVFDGLAGVMNSLVNLKQ